MFKIFFGVRQLFLSPDGGGDGGPINDSNPAPEPVNPLRTTPETIEPVVTEPIVEPDPVEEVDFGGRKLKVTDPAIKDLHGDWKEMNSTLTREQQQRKQLEDELAETRRALEAVQQPEPIKPNEPNEDRLHEINEKYMEMAYDNPIKAQVWLNQQPEFQQLMKSVHEQNVQTVMTETQQREANLNNQIKQNSEKLTEKYPDYLSLVKQMDEVVEQFPHIKEQLLSNPTVELMESVYFITKGRSGESSTPEPVAPTTSLETTQPSVEDLLNNPEFVQKVLQDEKVKQTIVKNYLDGVNSAQDRVPPSMDGGGLTPTLPEETYGNLRAASKGLKSWMRARSQ